MPIAQPGSGLCGGCWSYWICRACGETVGWGWSGEEEATGQKPEAEGKKKERGAATGQGRVLTAVPEGLCYEVAMCCAIAAVALVEVLQPERVCAAGEEKQRGVGRVDGRFGKGRRARGGGPVVVALAVPGQ